MTQVLKEFPIELFDVPSISDGRHPRKNELVMLDDLDLVEVLAWNSLPTYFVRSLKTKKLIEVEPWRLKKVEKTS